MDHNCTLLALACIIVSTYTPKSLGNLPQSRQEGSKVRLQRIQIRRYVIDFLKGGIFFYRSLSSWRIKCKTLMVALCCPYQAPFLGVLKFQDSSGEFWTAAYTVCSALHVWLLTEEVSPRGLIGIELRLSFMLHGLLNLQEVLFKGQDLGISHPAIKY